MAIPMKKPGVFDSRVNKVKKILEGKTAEEKAKAMVEYYSHGGSIDNILQLIEGKAVQVSSIRDLADSIGMKLERAEIPYVKVITNIQEQKVAIIFSRETPKETLQEATNRIGFPVDAKQTKKSWILKVDYAGQAIKTESQSSNKELKKVEQLFAQHSLPHTTNLLEHTIAKAKTMDSERLANETGLPFNLAQSIRKALKLEDSKRAITCSNCKGFMESVKENEFRCVSCLKIESFSAQQVYKAIIAENKKLCEMCGSPKIKLVEGKTKLVETEDCQNCGHTVKQEALTQADISPGTAGTNPNHDKIVVAGCPDCNGSLLDVGDSYRCLACKTSKMKDEINKSDIPSVESLKLEPANFTESSKRWKLQSGLPLIVEMSYEGDYESDDEQTPDYSKEIGEMGDYAVHVSGQNAKEAYEMLKSSGKLETAYVMKKEMGGAWAKMEQDDEPADEFMVSVPEMKAAQDIHHSLTSQEYPSLSVEMAGPDDDEMGMEDSGNMFASDEPEGEKPPEESANQASHLRMGEEDDDIGLDGDESPDDADMTSTGMDSESDEEPEDYIEPEEGYESDDEPEGGGEIEVPEPEEDCESDDEPEDGDDDSDDDGEELEEEEPEDDGEELDEKMGHPQYQVPVAPGSANATTHQTFQYPQGFPQYPAGDFPESVQGQHPGQQMDEGKMSVDQEIANINSQISNIPPHFLAESMDKPGISPQAVAPVMETINTAVGTEQNIVKDLFKESLIDVGAINQNLMEHKRKPLTEGQIKTISQLHSKRLDYKTIAHQTGIPAKTVRLVIGK